MSRLLSAISLPYGGLARIARPISIAVTRRAADVGAARYSGMDSAVLAEPRTRLHTARPSQPRSAAMPIASPDAYAEMLDRAKAGAFAYPAINVSSSQTLNAALRGFAEAESDGIIQVSTGGSSYLSGVDDMAVRATALSAYAHVNAPKNTAPNAPHP